MTIPRASIRRKHQPQILSYLERKELGAQVQSKRSLLHSVSECPDTQKIKNILPEYQKSHRTLTEKRTHLFTGRTEERYNSFTYFGELLFFEVEGKRKQNEWIPWSKNVKDKGKRHKLNKKG